MSNMESGIIEATTTTTTTSAPHHQHAPGQQRPRPDKTATWNKKPKLNNHRASTTSSTTDAASQRHTQHASPIHKGTSTIASRQPLHRQLQPLSRPAGITTNTASAAVCTAPNLTKNNAPWPGPRRFSPNEDDDDDMDCDDSDIDSVFELNDRPSLPLLLTKPVDPFPKRDHDANNDEEESTPPKLETKNLQSLFDEEEQLQQLYDNATTAAAAATTATMTTVHANQGTKSTIQPNHAKMPPPQSTIATTTTTTTTTLLQKYLHRPADNEEVVHAMLTSGNRNHNKREERRLLQNVSSKQRRRDQKEDSPWIGRVIGGTSLERSESLEHSVLSGFSNHQPVFEAVEQQQEQSRQHQPEEQEQQQPSQNDTRGDVVNNKVFLPNLHDDDNHQALEEKYVTPSFKPRFTIPKLPSLRPSQQQQPLSAQMKRTNPSPSEPEFQPPAFTPGKPVSGRSRRLLEFPSSHVPTPDMYQATSTLVVDDYDIKSPPPQQELWARSPPPQHELLMLLQEEQPMRTPPFPALHHQEHVSDEVVVHDQDDSSTAPVWSQSAAGIRSQKAVLEINGKKYIHPELPAGWKVQVCQSRALPYYCHPHYGITWYCPIVLPKHAHGESTSSPTSVCSVSLGDQVGSICSLTADVACLARIEEEEYEEKGDDEDYYYDRENAEAPQRDGSSSPCSSTTARSEPDYEASLESGMDSVDDISLGRAPAPDGSRRSAYDTPLLFSSNHDRLHPLTSTATTSRRSRNSSHENGDGILGSQQSATPADRDGQVVYTARHAHRFAAECSVAFVTPKMTKAAHKSLETATTGRKHPTWAITLPTPSSTPWNSCSSFHEELLKSNNATAKPAPGSEQDKLMIHATDLERAGEEDDISLTSMALRQHEETMNKVLADQGYLSTPTKRTSQPVDDDEAVILNSLALRQHKNLLDEHGHEPVFTPNIARALFEPHDVSHFLKPLNARETCDAELNHALSVKGESASNAGSQHTEANSEAADMIKTQTMANNARAKCDADAINNLVGLKEKSIAKASSLQLDASLDMVAEFEATPSSHNKQHPVPKSADINTDTETEASEDEKAKIETEMIASTPARDALSLALNSPSDGGSEPEFQSDRSELEVGNTVDAETEGSNDDVEDEFYFETNVSTPVIDESPVPKSSSDRGSEPTVQSSGSEVEIGDTVTQFQDEFQQEDELADASEDDKSRDEDASVLPPSSNISSARRTTTSSPAYSSSALSPRQVVAAHGHRRRRGSRNEEASVLPPSSVISSARRTTTSSPAFSTTALSPRQVVVSEVRRRRREMRRKSSVPRCSLQNLTAILLDAARKGTLMYRNGKKIPRSRFKEAAKIITRVD